MKDINMLLELYAGSVGWELPKDNPIREYLFVRNLYDVARMRIGKLSIDMHGINKQEVVMNRQAYNLMKRLKVLEYSKAYKDMYDSHPKRKYINKEGKALTTDECISKIEEMRELDKIIKYLYVYISYREREEKEPIEPLYDSDDEIPKGMIKEIFHLIKQGMKK